ncbi:TolC family protein, partial [Methylogaea oryzae]|uniref:TolC family protein n=1 Tax=Methylogaea oryzae TaxID=1295382 RepID=UPI00138F5A20
MLPPLDLNAQSGWGILALGHLVTPYGAIYNLAATLTATIFDNGKRTQEVAFARALHEELVETYMRVIYTAVRETEDALANVHNNGKRLEAQQLATEAALRAWQASQDSFGVGDLDFLTLLDTERTYHRNLDEYHRVRMERYRGVIALFNALGGGV